MTVPKRMPRLLVQLACLSIAALLVWPALPWATAPRFVAQGSIFVAICSAIAGREIAFGAALGIAIAVVCVFRRRWFCRYLCPTGLLLEGAARLGLRKVSWWAVWPSFGRYAAILTVAGAIAGYPLLLWMDPLAIFSGPFAARGAGDVVSGVLAGALLGVLIVASLLFGLIWCMRICPLGGAQELLSLAGPETERRGVQRASGPLRNPRMPVARRALLAGLVGAGLAIWARKSGSARGLDDRPLRPPGAVADERFSGICIRCGNCVRACPSKIIRPDIGDGGFAGLLAPVILYDRPKYCLEDCNACTQVCPSGALQALDLPNKRRHVIGEALVDGTVCLLTLGKKECNVCERACPFDAISIVWDENSYIAYPAIDARKCNGCGACEVACPTNPIRAIRVWKV